MTIANLLHRYADYNVWANTRFAEWLQAHPAEVLHRPIVNSFPTLRKTIEHFHGAEWLWFNRLKGNSPASFPPEEMRDLNDADFFKALLQTSANLRDLVRSYHEAQLSETCSYKFLNGTETSSIRAEMIQHCLQHSTFHRGQVVTLARQAGIDSVPSTDFIVFAREHPHENS